MLDSPAKALADAPLAISAAEPLQIADASVKDQAIDRIRILSAYKQMLASLFLATLVVIGLLIILIMPFFILLMFGKVGSESASIFVVVVLAGSLGALFSAMIRLYNFEDLPKALIIRELQDLPSRYLLIYSLVPIVIGAIAAAVLYVVFAAGLITGNFVPEFDCVSTGNGCKTFIEFVGYWSPKSAPDFAKVLVWGFIAGFAERFVPDTLRTLTHSTSQQSHSPADTEQSKGQNSQSERAGAQ